MDEFRILLTGGGSGGHVYPLLAVVDVIRSEAAQKDILPSFYYYGPKDEWSDVLKKADVNVRYVLAPKLRRYFSLANFATPFLFIANLIQVLFKMYWLMPDVIFSKGGPGALATVLVGWFYRIPIIVHESDAIPGMTNIISGRFARAVAIGFESAFGYFSPRKVTLTGNPIRPELLRNQLNQRAAKQELQFDPEEPLLLVWGGSQGSKRMNEFVLSNLRDIVKNMQVLHQTGEGNYHEVQQLSRAALIDVPLQAAAKSRYQPIPYLGENLGTALAASDIVLSRAGAGSIHEIAAFGKPAILVPLEESAGGHQKANAYDFEKSGGAIVIEEENFLSGVVLSQLTALLKNKEKLDEMRAASKAFFKPNAASLIAEEILNIGLNIG